MGVKQLEEMDFFDLKLLKDKKGTLYVRNNDVFIYSGDDKIKMNNNHPGTIDPFGIETILNDNLPGRNKSNVLFIGDKVIHKLDHTKDTKGEGHFWFWQVEEYFALCFVTENNKAHKGTVYLLHAGNATHSL